MNRLPQEIIDKITVLLDLESILVFEGIFKRNVYYAIKEVYLQNKSEYTFKTAAKNNWLNIMKFLKRQGTDNYTYEVMDIASEYGNIDIVKWLFSKGYTEYSADAIDVACINNHYCVAVYLYMNSVETPNFRCMKTVNLIILLDCLKELYKSLDNNPFIDNIFNVREMTDECVSRLSKCTSQLDCYSDLEILKYVYIGASVSKKKYTSLINGYIRGIIKNDVESKKYFKYADLLVKKFTN